MKFLLPVAWAIFILLLCSIPGKDIPTAGWMQVVSLDKWVHFTLFGIQMVLVLWVIRSHYPPETRWDGRWFWLIAVVAYGALTEVYQQAFLTDRYADVYDFVANSAGAVTGWIIYERYFSRHKRTNTYRKTF